MKKAKTILFWLVSVLLVLAILAVAVPKLFGVQMRAVLTGSMEPELPVGALVFIVPTPFEQIQEGDDISFVPDESLKVVTHRVVEIDTQNQKFVTRGIANQVNDPKAVTYENTIGKVALSIPVLGYVVAWFDPLPNKIIALIVIVAIIAAWMLLGSEDKKKKEGDQGNPETQEHKRNQNEGGKK